MRRFLSLLLLGCLCLLLPLGLCACGGESDGAPSGMQRVTAGRPLPYTLYVPTSWTVTTSGLFVQCYVSSTNTASVTVATQAYEPADGLEDNRENRLAAMREYLSGQSLDSIAAVTELQAGEPEEIVVDGTVALQRTDTYLYGGAPYGTILVVTAKDGLLYLLNFTASNEKANGIIPFERDGETFRTRIVANMHLTPTPADSEKADTPVEGEEVTAQNGIVLRQIADRTVSDYRFYAPLGWSIDMTRGITVAVADDRTSISIKRSTPIGYESAIDYFNAKFTAYGKIYENLVLTEKRGEDGSYILDNRHAVAYTYTFSYHGTPYRVTEVMTVVGSDVYTILYTASDASAEGQSAYERHLPEWAAVLEQLRID